MHGYCIKHHRRWAAHGDPLYVKNIQDPVERFHAKVKRLESGCWEWQGEILSNGYGRICVRQRRELAHRWSYEHHVGPIPDGLVIDHECNNPRCVNPDHLRPMTQQENVLRSETDLAAINARKTHCLRGHEFDSANTYMQRGTRQCRKCKCIRERDRQRRRRAERLVST
ncbi:HNH endonuclease [Rhodococcus hoagii]|uniref:HNH endonuclease n=1 Tax=Rhodococcus hoagii TaxID=43767 RepID=A0AAE2W8V9_RHOHA|nr:HNH endonuclease [Prescottella equi]